METGQDVADRAEAIRHRIDAALPMMRNDDESVLGLGPDPDPDTVSVIRDFLVATRAIHNFKNAGDAAKQWHEGRTGEARQSLAEEGLSHAEIDIAFDLATRMCVSPLGSR